MLKKISLLLAAPFLLMIISAFIDKKAAITTPAQTEVTTHEKAFNRWLPFITNTKKVQAPKRLVTDALYPNQALNPGDFLVSPNGDYTLIMQHDGNLVLYDYWGTPVWDSGTCCTSDMSGVLMQTDGNLVMYDIYAVPHWASNTSNYPNGFARVTDWGAVYVIQGGLVRWSSTW
jgi:hypothetical protein